MDDFDLNLKPEHVPASALPYVQSEPLSVEDFGKWLKALREEAGLTLTQLGDLIGYSNPYLSQIENGKKKNYPSPELLKKLSQHLPVAYSDMLRLAGYAELAKGVRIQEIKAMFESEDVDEDERISELVLNVDEHYLLIVKDIEQAAVKHLSDLKNALENDFTPVFSDQPAIITFNGHPLTKQDRKRILGMLELMFPEYSGQNDDDDDNHDDNDDM